MQNSPLNCLNFIFQFTKNANMPNLQVSYSSELFKVNVLIYTAKYAKLLKQIDISGMPHLESKYSVSILFVCCTSQESFECIFIL